MDLQKLVEFYRGVKRWEICEGCSGTGVKLYGSTSTWRGGIGGCTMTRDVCNACWGSGSSKHKWPSHKEFEEMRITLSN